MYEYRIARLNKVVDGDTIDVEIDLGFDISLSKRIRLAGIDTPESRTKDLQEKALGLEAKEWLKQRLENAELIRIKTVKPDSTEKYGRILGWLYSGDDAFSINEEMIQKGLAWSYLGDAKVKDFALLAQVRQSNQAL